MSATMQSRFNWDAIVKIVEAKYSPPEKSEKLEVYLKRWRNHERLNSDEARDAFTCLMKDKDVTDYQIGVFLVHAQPEFLSEDEIAGFASVLRDSASRVSAGEAIGDTCGTGGDTFPTFNVSTTIMFVLAAAGIKIAKHGNRAFTSKCGSADVLQELGVVIDLGPEQVQQCLQKIGLGFMFAPNFHPATSRVQQMRKILADELPVKFKTIFNVLGPLSNPARAPWQMLGVYDEKLVQKLAHVMQSLKLERGLVFHGHSSDKREAGEKGLDEVSTIGPTIFAELKSGAISSYALTPEDMGLRRANPDDISGGDVRCNASILDGILNGSIKGPKRDLVVANAAVGLYLGSHEPKPLKDCIQGYIHQADELISSGKAYSKFKALKEETVALSELGSN